MALVSRDEDQVPRDRHRGDTQIRLIHRRSTSLQLGLEPPEDSGVGFLEGQAEQLKKLDTLQDVRARMLYDAAWGTRLLAEPEVDAARAALAKEMQAKLGPAAMDAFGLKGWWGALVPAVLVLLFFRWLGSGKKHT